MTTRRERVVLELDDQFTAPAARAAAAAALLNREVSGIGRSSRDVGPNLDRSSRSIDGLGNSARRSGPEIDRLSGRLGLARDAILTLGPAAVPIGAAVIPALVGLSAALGSAALGAGVAIGAFQGVGDAVKALSKADLEPTAQNLQAAREALEDLSPAAAGFVTQIHDLIPALKQIRDSAAEGLFPGLSEGIDDLERRLPIINRIAGSVGEALGNLAADAGESLSSGRWGPFLRFIEDEAPGAITSLGHIIGDLAHGVGELFMAFDPLSDGVISGLEKGADAFDKWTSSLDGSKGFEDFVSYIQESGPLVADALGSIGDAVVQILKAVAPLGQDSLRVITAFADAVALIAGSDLGGPLLIAAGAFAVYNRGAAVANSLTTRFSGGLSSLSKGGVVGLAVLGLEAIGTAANKIEAGFDRTIPSVNGLTSALLDLGSAQAAAKLNEDIGLLGPALDKLDATGLDSLSTKLTTAANDGGLLGTALKGLSYTPIAPGLINPIDAKELREAKASIEGIDNALAGLVASAGPDRAKEAFEQLASAQHLTKDQTAELLSLLPNYSSALDGVANDAKIAADGVDEAAEATQRFSAALADLNGWLDKRAAIRGYRDDVVALAKGLRDGFGRKDVEQIDKTAASIAKVASSIKDKDVRADFLAGARKSLADLAGTSAPKARAEIEKVIGKLDQYGLTQPPTPKLDVNSKPATAKGEEVGRLLRGVGAIRANPSIGADVGNALGGISAVRSALDALNGKTAVTHVRTVRDGGFGPQPAAGGTTVPKTGKGYADRHLYMLADGEEVISNRYGQADRNRDLLKAINANRMATGGTTGTPKRSARPPRFQVVDDDDPRYNAPDGAKNRVRYFKDFEHDAKKALHRLQHSLDSASATVDANKDAVDRETSARDALQSSFDSLSSSITGMLTSDLFGGGSGNPFSASASSDPISILMSDIAGNQQFQDLFAGLRAEGLHGGALTAAAQGGIAGLQTLSAYNPEQIAQFQQLFDIREQQGAATGQQVAQAQFGQALAEANTKADIANAIAAQSLVQQAAIEAAIRNQEQTVKQSSALVEKATKDISSTAAKGGRSKTRKNR